MKIPLDPDHADLRGGAVRGVGWSAAQKVGGQLASLLTFVVLARLLEPEDFGLVALASAIVTLTTMLFDLSITHYLVQQVKLETRTIDTAFWSALLLGILAALVVAALAPLASILLDEPRLTPVLVALACTVPLTSLSAVPQTLLRRSLSFNVVSRRVLFATFVSGVVGIGLAFAGAGAWSLVAQAYALPLVSIVLFYGVAAWRPGFSWNRSEAKMMMRYGASLWGMSFLSVARSGGPTFIVGAVLGSTVLGVFVIATRLVKNVSNVVGGVVLQVVPPVLAAAKGDPDRVRRGYLVGLSSAATCVAPVTLLLAAVSGVLVPFVFGQQWSQSGGIAQVIALGAAVTVLTQFDRGLFLALDLPKVELRTMALTTIAGLLLVAATAPVGLMAVAIGVTASGYVAWLWRLRVVQVHAGVPAATVLRILLPIWLAAAVAGSCSWGVLMATRSWGDAWSLAMAVLTFTVSYPLALRLLARPTVRTLRTLVPQRLEKRALSRIVLRTLLGPSPK